MKKLVVLCILLVTAVGVSYFSLSKFKKTTPSSSDDKTASQPTPIGNSGQNVSNDVNISWIEVSDLTKLKLYSNLEAKYSSFEAKQKYKCNFITSGGFYTQEGRHIGLFVTDGEVVEKFQKNSTLNGFFFIAGNTADITSSSPNSPLLGIQAGPILMSGNVPSKLALNRDERARRVVIATNGKHVFLIVLYSKSNAFSGPKLADLPELLVNLKIDRGLGFDSALNLDGGNHSVFLSDTVKLVESAKAGGFFCVLP